MENTFMTIIIAGAIGALFGIVLFAVAFPAILPYVPGLPILNIEQAAIAGLVLGLAIQTIVRVSGIS